MDSIVKSQSNEGCEFIAWRFKLIVVEIIIFGKSNFIGWFFAKCYFFSINRIETDILILVILCYNVNCVKRFLYFENYRAMLKSNIRIIDFALYIYIYDCLL